VIEQAIPVITIDWPGAPAKDYRRPAGQSTGLEKLLDSGEAVPVCWLRRAEKSRRFDLTNEEGLNGSGRLIWTVAVYPPEDGQRDQRMHSRRRRRHPAIAVPKPLGTGASQVAAIPAVREAC